ncbi:LytR/AlgR family response regulator transcription factor [Alteromonas gilva]|uniref:LytTR family DNA-binding domain-containing protein n=1 Tax=Alteromonas gilva TaxID=2987522 RepID=A0ABT5L5W0_9ALTE|nr:LytTR family DNA-binding domain-containing protein [Alteromonas gilva]MDC8832435.1 LytTR family DNA-binding domain-containing protein [Alteromonas gilva]
MAGSLITLASVIVVPGFDLKTTVGLSLPVSMSLYLTARRWLKDRPKTAGTWTLVQSLFVCSALLARSAFHDTVYFLLLAGLLIYLFFQQAALMRQQMRKSEEDRQVITKLEYRLAETQQRKSPTKLEISTNGKTEFVRSEQLAFCQAAGDYVELNLLDGSQKLFTGTLRQLESLLPETFVRVHRSYMVNLDKVAALSAQSETTTAMLKLENAQTVPVSRRLLPVVRATLKAR